MDLALNSEPCGHSQPPLPCCRHWPRSHGSEEQGWQSHAVPHRGYLWPYSDRLPRIPGILDSPGRSAAPTTSTGAVLQGGSTATHGARAHSLQPPEPAQDQGMRPTQAGVGTALHGSPQSLAEASISCCLPRPLPGTGPAWEQELQYSRILGVAGHQVCTPPAPQPWGAELQPGWLTQVTFSSRGRRMAQPCPRSTVDTESSLRLPPSVGWCHGEDLGQRSRGPQAAFWLLAACGAGKEALSEPGDWL